ncbi:MAG: radical SAM family heme chaperone HemW [Clostridia bacterium]|nr:radical SAM family heme chaperone HemW [Clostridia bacterium]
MQTSNWGAVQGNAAPLFQQKNLSLYLHIPFCKSKCLYCDFASWANQDHWMADYVDALLSELDGWRAKLEGRTVQTVYIGGGTPTLLPINLLEKILYHIRKVAPLAPQAEITIEANPGTVTREKLTMLRQCGVNRLSIGAQAMEDRLLKGIGRIHTVAETCEAVALGRSCGIENINLDLMIGLPEQSGRDWFQTLEAAIALKPEHISAYTLIVEEGTPLYALVERGAVTPPDEDETIEMQRAAIDRLQSAGYARYEISNYALPDRECRHNLVYWLRGDYLGLGCAAHSMIDNVRFENPRSLQAYLRGTRAIRRVPLSREERMEETLMLSTRLIRGMDLNAYRREFGEDFVATHTKTLDRLLNMGLVEIHANHLYLTQKGLEVQNAVLVELLA